MLKRTISLVLALALIITAFTVLPVSAAGAGEENLSDTAIDAITETAEESVEEPQAETAQTADAQAAAEPATETELAQVAAGPDSIIEGKVAAGDGSLSYSRTVSEDFVRITGAENLSGDVAVPDAIEGYPVTVISDNALAGQEALSSITLPASVTEIGARAFLGCSSMKEVTLSDTLTAIGEKAFGYTADEQKRNDFTVKGYKPSLAETYAAENGLTFIDITNGDYPQITGFSDEGDSVKVSWDSYGSNTIYRLFRQNDKGVWVCIAQVEGNSVRVKQTGDTNANYTLRCVDADGKFTSPYNVVGWNYYYQAPPEIAAFKNTSKGVNIYWKNTFACPIRVYRRTPGTNWKSLNGATAFDNNLAYVDPADGSKYMYFTDTTAQYGVNYIYTLRAVNEEQTQYLSGFTSGKSYTRPTLTEMTSVQNTDTGVKISWKKYNGAALYRVYYHDERSGQNSWDLLDKGWKGIANTTSLSYTDTSAPNASQRVYTVRAFDSKGAYLSDYDHVGINNLYYSAPVIKSATGTAIKQGDGTVTGSVTLHWDALPNVEYRVYRRLPTTSWSAIAQLEGNTYTDNTALPGVKYIYTLRVIAKTGGYLSYFTSGKTVLFTETPEITGFTNVANGATIAWNKVNGASYYRLYYKKSNGVWTTLAAKVKDSYTDTSLKHAETRVYTIRALDENGNLISDYNHTGWTNTFYLPPIIRSLESTVDGVRITWARARGAAAYRLYRKTNKGWQKLTETMEGEYTDKNVVSGTNYTYTLRMVNDKGNAFISAFNNGKSILYVAAPKITGFANTRNGAKLAWSKSAGADKYRVFYKNTNNVWTCFGETADNNFTDKSAPNGKQRVYTVRAMKNGRFVSDFVKAGWSNTFFAAPAISSVTSSSGNNVVSWKAQNGVAGYRLYRKTFSGNWGQLFNKTTNTSYTDTAVNKGWVYAYTLRYLDGSGKLISDYIDNVKYYKDGKPVNGHISYKGSTYGFKDGYLLTGLKRVDGKLRCYSSTGKLYRDTIVKTGSGYYYTDTDGYCWESEEMRLAAEFIAVSCKGSNLKERMKYAFLYLAENYPYERVYNDMPNDESDVKPFAIELFERKKGTCYRYAAGYACICKIAGYRSRFAYGKAGTLLHGWTEVYVDGEWLMCDVDAQLPGYGFADYYPYMMSTHIWSITKEWYTELNVSNGNVYWGAKTYF